MAKGSKRSNRSDARPSTLTVRLRSRPPLPPDRLTANFKAPASGPARLFNGQPAKFSISSSSSSRQEKYPSKKSFRTAQIAFSAPQETLVCIRRRRRQEVLHAFKKTGRAGQRKPRNNKWRDYKC